MRGKCFFAFLAFGKLFYKKMKKVRNFLNFVVLYMEYVYLSLQENLTMKTINFVKSRVSLLFCLCLLASACGGGGGPGLSAVPSDGGEGNNLREQGLVASGIAGNLVGNIGNLQDEVPGLLAGPKAGEVNNDILQNTGTLGQLRDRVEDLRRQLDDALNTDEISSQIPNIRKLIDDIAGIQKSVNDIRNSLEILCPDGTPILGNDTDLGNEGAGFGGCRAPVRAADCRGDTPILDGGNCRARRVSDCVSGMPILDAGECRALRESDCRNLKLDDSGNFCRVRVASDCTGETPILDGDTCRAQEERDCLAFEEFRNGSCQTRVAEDCEGEMFLDRNGECIPPPIGGFLPNEPSCELQLPDGRGGCRPLNAGDCTGDKPVLDDSGLFCRVRVASDCTGDTPVLDGQTNECRAQEERDCLSFEEFRNGSCRTRVALDCTGDTPVFTASGECRPRNDEDCTGDTPVLDGQTNECRARIAADCTGDTPVLGENKECRARIAADCTGDTPILDGQTNECRALEAADCSTGTELISGQCRFVVPTVSTGRRLAQVGLPIDESCPTGYVQIGIECYSEANVEDMLDSERDARIAHCKTLPKVEAQTTPPSRIHGKISCERAIDDSIDRTKNALSNNCGIGERFVNGNCSSYFIGDSGFFRSFLEPDHPLASAWREGMYVRFQQSRGLDERTMRKCNDGDVLPVGEACGEFRTEEYGRNYGLRMMNTEYAYRQGAFGQDVTIALFSDIGPHEDFGDNIDTNGVNGEWAAPVVGIIAALRNNGKGTHGVAPQSKIIRQPNIFDAVNNGVKIIMEPRNLGNNYYYPRIFQGVFRGEEYRVGLVGNHPAAWDSEDYAGAAAIAALAEKEDAKKDGFVVVTPNHRYTEKLNLRHHHDRTNIRICQSDRNFCLPYLTGKIIRNKGRVSSSRGKMEEAFGFSYEEFAAGFSITVNGTVSALANFDIPDDNVPIPHVPHAFFPDVHPELEDNWLVAADVAHEYLRDRWGRPFSDHAYNGNSCGSSKMWCVAAPGLHIYTTHKITNYLIDNDYGRPVYYLTGTSAVGYSSDRASAAHAAGALAVLKSFAGDALPMTQIRNILLTTATDLGIPGIDDDYGWGLVNIEAGIKHIESMRTHTSNGRFAAQGLNDLRALLPASLSHLKGRLGEVKVAMQITDNSYYNIPLSDIVRFAPDEAPDIGGFALDMLNSGGGNNAESFGFAETDKIAAPFFAGSSGEVLDLPGDGLRPFAVIDNSTGNLADGNFQQFGFRWRKSGERFGVRAEVSRIEEKGGFMGTDFGMLGSPSGSESAQGSNYAKRQNRARLGRVCGIRACAH